MKHSWQWLAVFGVLSLGSQAVFAWQTPTVNPTATRPFLFNTSDLSERLNANATKSVANQAASRCQTRAGQLSSLAESQVTDTAADCALSAYLAMEKGDNPNAFQQVALNAFAQLGDKDPADRLLDMSGTPAEDQLDVLQDSGRLQSLAEAYDLLAASQLTSVELQPAANRIAQWANAFMQDWNLTGAVGVEGHRDNWGIRGGSALVSAGLALYYHPDANAWRTTGLRYVRESFERVGTDGGFYRESVWYLNYALGVLLPAAYHVQAAGGGDWFSVLRPYVETSLYLRQPDGLVPAFEEGIAAVVPWDLMAKAYSDIAGELLWAYQTSNRATGNYELHKAQLPTRFFVISLTATATIPTQSASAFVADDVNLSVLRSGWGANALYSAMITAIDYSKKTVTDARHHIINPLELTFFAEGMSLLPPGGGGPEVTRSENRKDYLKPKNHNIPLVSGNARYLLKSDEVHFYDNVDSQEDRGYVDASRTMVTDYAGSDYVQRSHALVSGQYVVVSDSFQSAGVKRKFSQIWRGRGTRTTRVVGDGIAIDWNKSGHLLHLRAASSDDLAVDAITNYYAPTWGQQEVLDAVEVKAKDKRVTTVSLLFSGSTSIESESIQAQNGAGFRVASTNGVDHIAATHYRTVATVGEITSDGAIAMVRESGLGFSDFSLVGGGYLAWNGLEIVAVNTPVGLSASYYDGQLIVDLAEDVDGVRMVFKNLQFSGKITGVTVLLDGVSYPVNKVKFGNGALTLDGLSAGQLEITPCTQGQSGCVLASDAAPTLNPSVEYPKPWGCSGGSQMGMLLWLGLIALLVNRRCQRE